MSAELNAVNNIMAGVRKSTGKGQAGIRKIAQSSSKTATRIYKKKEAARKAAEAEEKRKEKEKKKTSSKPTSSNKTSKPTSSNKTKNSSPKGKTPGVGNVREALGSGKISIEEASKLNPKGTSTPISKKPSETFTPKSKQKKATQPALPGMTKSKINQA